MKNADEIVIDVGLWTLTLFFLYIVYSVVRILLPFDVVGILTSIVQLIVGILVLGALLVAVTVGAFSISEGGLDEGVTTLARSLSRLR